MSDRLNELIATFRDALTDCKRLYAHAARDCLEPEGRVTVEQRREFIRRMVDLHKGLLIKIYVTVARADSRWSRAEQALATELIDHVWQKRLEGKQLQQAARRMFQDANQLKWYSLIRPFDQVKRLRDKSVELETIVMRIGTLVAKSDGTATDREMRAIQQIQKELDIHLRRIALDDAATPANDSGGQSSAVQIVHQESQAIRQQHQLQDESAVPTNGETEGGGLDQAMQELHELIGLQKVKQEIETLTNFLQLQRRRKAANLPCQDLGLHMVFQGNPGTGKTTVARIVGRILSALGFLEKGHLIETDRTGLVAEYAGQTGPKANRKIDEALDGVLFIDEAYSLVSSQQDDAYGHEAVQALIKRMEDQRDRLVVILAGYPGPMRDLLRSNPGMSSRFGTQLTFEDYQPVELARIFQIMCDTNRYQLPPASRTRLLVGLQWMYDHRDEHFGNGRLVRNLFEKSIRKLGNRVASASQITRELLTQLTVEDIHMPRVPTATWEELRLGQWQFEYVCPSCQAPTAIEAASLGSDVVCPQCGTSSSALWAAPVRS